MPRALSSVTVSPGSWPEEIVSWLAAKRLVPSNDLVPVSVRSFGVIVA